MGSRTVFKYFQSSCGRFCGSVLLTSEPHLCLRWRIALYSLQWVDCPFRSTGCFARKFGQNCCRCRYFENNKIYSLEVLFFQVRPHGFIGVPRIWEKYYEKLQEIGSKNPKPLKAISTWAKHQGLKYNNAYFDNK